MTDFKAAEVIKYNYEIEKLEFRLRTIEKLINCETLTVNFSSPNLNKRFCTDYVIYNAQPILRNVLVSEKEMIITHIDEFKSKLNKLLK